jgi:hypothetical protein
MLLWSWLAAVTCDTCPLAYQTPTRRLPDALNPGFYGVRTRWNQGFMAFQSARRTWTVRLMVPL